MSAAHSKPQASAAPTPAPGLRPVADPREDAPATGADPRGGAETSATAGAEAGTGPGAGSGLRAPGEGARRSAEGAGVGVVADVVLPCLDEVEALPWVLERIPAGWTAIVVDNGSSDGSGEVAARLGARVVREPRRGFGAACHAGLLAARAEFVCFCDCDASLDPALLVDFVREVAEDGADLVIGRRRPTARGAWPPHARAGNLAVARMLRRRTGLRLHDIGPLRAARRTALLGLDVADRRSGYPLETLVRAADAGWRVTEHPVPYHPRTGASKVTGTWRGTWQAVHDMSAVLAAPPARLADGTPRGRTGNAPADVPRPADPSPATGVAQTEVRVPAAASRAYADAAAPHGPAVPHAPAGAGGSHPAATAAAPDGGPAPAPPSPGTGSTGSPLADAHAAEGPGDAAGRATIGGKR